MALFSKDEDINSLTLRISVQHGPKRSHKDVFVFANDESSSRPVEEKIPHIFEGEQKKVH